MPNITLFMLVLFSVLHKLTVLDAHMPAGYQDLKHVSFCRKTVFRTLGSGLCLLTQALADIWHRHHGKFSIHHRRRLVLLYLLLLLLLMSYAPEPNPGPSHPSGTDETHYPCGTCDATVNWSEKGVACETCGMWFHARCQSIDSGAYDNLHDEDAHWHCAICGNPNSLTALDLHGVDWSDTSHHMASVSKSDLSSCTTPTEANFHPQHSSTPTRTSQQNKWKNRPLRLLNVNFQSAVGKRAETPNLCDSTKPDILIGTETWLDDTIANREILPDLYTVYRKDRNRDGGGVFIAVRNHLKSFPAPELSTDCEMVWVGVKLQGRKTLYLCAYYRPKTADEASLVKFGESLDRATRIPNAFLLIGGDFNLPSWDWPTMSMKPSPVQARLHNSFIDMLHDHGLEQLVMEPTRLDNTLDLLLTNCPHLVPRVEVIPGLSDHDIPYCEFNITAQKIRQVPRMIPLYNKADWESMKKALRNLHTELAREKDSLTTEQLWSKFRDTTNDAVKSFIPHKKARQKDSKPWITPEIRKLVGRRDRVYKKMKKQGTEELRIESKRLRGLIQRKLRRSYWDYISKTLTDDQDYPNSSHSLKRFWTFVKHQRTSKTGVSPLKVNGQLVADPKAQAEILNDQFQSVFSEGKEYTDEEFQAKCQMREVQLSSLLTNLDISEEGILKLLTNLNPYKACGPDNIGPRVLKELAAEAAPILTTIYRSSINTGEVPSDWRDANVTPVFKKGEHYNPANYRPVSLTSVSCKILEHVIVRTLMHHLESNNILRPEQHGFRKSRSCETQLLEFTEQLNENMERGNQADIIIMDFAKAFDRVNHSLLLHKLHQYGVQGKVNQWLKAFLRDRRQAVVVNGATSDYSSVRSGVPQGSVVGPVLFLAYINDLPEQLTSLTRLFADDTAVYRLNASTHDQYQLQLDLQLLERWEQSWDMAFHPGKCIALPVTRKRTIAEPHYQLHGHTLANVTSAKYLGVTITRDLSWDEHISNICAKANKTLGFLRRNLKIGATHLKETAYKTLVRPILEYACTVWDPHTQNNIDAIEAVQRRAARFVVNRYHNTSSVSAMINRLGWPTLQHRRKVSRLAMLRKILKLQATVDRTKLVHAPERQRRGHSQQLRQIQCRTNYRQFSFFPNTIRDWNDLPEPVVTADTLDTFKSRVPQN